MLQAIDTVRQILPKTHNLFSLEEADKILVPAVAFIKKMECDRPSYCVHCAQEAFIELRQIFPAKVWHDLDKLSVYERYQHMLEVAHLLNQIFSM